MKTALNAALKAFARNLPTGRALLINTSLQRGGSSDLFRLQRFSTVFRQADVHAPPVHPRPIFLNQKSKILPKTPEI